MTTNLTRIGARSLGTVSLDAEQAFCLARELTHLAESADTHWHARIVYQGYANSLWAVLEQAQKHLDIEPQEG